MELKDYILAAMLNGIPEAETNAEVKSWAVQLAGIVACGGKDKEEIKNGLLKTAESIYAQLPSLIEKLKAL